MENNETSGVAPTQNDAESAIDFEQEYKKQALEIEKLKNAISKTNSENAEYKRKELEHRKKELDKMSEEEKNAAKLSELVEANSKLEAELKQFRIEKDLLSNGFTAEESEKLIKGGLAVKDFAEILKNRLEEQEKTLKATLLKGSTPSQPMGNGTTNGSKSKSQFALYQEEKAARSKTGKVEL